MVQQLNPLTWYAETIHKNFATMMENRAPLSSAAEAVHNGLQTLFTEAVTIEGKDNPLGMVAVMGMAAHSSWIDAFVLTGAGHTETGLAAGRRAIEFTCYAAKVAKAKKSTKMAEDWMRHFSDPKARKRFSAKTRIPGAYDTEEYRFLWPLIVDHDVASEAGVHANLASLQSKWDGVKDGKLFLRHQAEAEETVFNSVHMVVIGHQVYRAFSEMLASSVTDANLQESMAKYVDTELRKLQLGYADFKYQGKVPSHVVKGIISDDKTLMEREFKALVERYTGSSANATEPGKAAEASKDA
jgi:hypothetical protein